MIETGRTGTDTGRTTCFGDGQDTYKRLPVCPSWTDEDGQLYGHRFPEPAALKRGRSSWNLLCFLCLYGFCQNTSPGVLVAYCHAVRYA